jgi:hypothetical protein
MYEPRPPARDRRFLEFVRRQPCLLCVADPPPSSVPQWVLIVEAAHTNALGPRGMGQKASDYSAVPLCAWHHRLSRNSLDRRGARGFRLSRGALAATVRDLLLGYDPGQASAEVGVALAIAREEAIKWV